MSTLKGTIHQGTRFDHHRVAHLREDATPGAFGGTGMGSPTRVRGMPWWDRRGRHKMAGRYATLGYTERAPQMIDPAALRRTMIRAQAEIAAKIDRLMRR